MYFNMIEILICSLIICFIAYLISRRPNDWLLVHSESVEYKTWDDYYGHKIEDSVRYKCSLGDVVGYGHNPKQVIERLKGFDVAIMGNHDSLILGKNNPSNFTKEARDSVERHQKELESSDLEILSRQTPYFSRGNIILFHGTPKNPNEYLMNEKNIRHLIEENTKYDLFFGGHMHMPRVALYDKKTGKIEFEDVTTPLSRHHLDLNKKKYVVNCPSATLGRLHQKGISGCCTVHHSSKSEKVLNFYFKEIEPQIKLVKSPNYAAFL